jgi:hypothetical protein
MLKNRKVIGSLLLFFFIISFIGCATIKVGGNAQLAPSKDVGSKIGEKRYWYVLWGLVPLGDNSTDNYIPTTANKVRVETKQTVLDFVFNLFTGIVTIVSRTAEIYEVK